MKAERKANNKCPALKPISMRAPSLNSCMYLFYCIHRQMRYIYLSTTLLSTSKEIYITLLASIAKNVSKTIMVIQVSLAIDCGSLLGPKNYILFL